MFCSFDACSHFPLLGVSVTSGAVGDDLSQVPLEVSADDDSGCWDLPQRCGSWGKETTAVNQDPAAAGMLS